MSAIIPTKAALQAIPVDRERLHTVRENRAWYYGDPVSTETPDGENVLAPNTGPGRYLKHLSANLQNSLIWQAITTAGNFTATPNTGYIFDFTNIPGDITASLPGAPELGSSVRFIYASPTNIQKRLIFTAGATPINGLTGNFFLFQRNQEVSLTWCGSVLGWQYNAGTAGPLAPLPLGTAQVFTAPNATNTAQNGIFNWLGRLGNLANPYQNPASAALTNGFYLFGFNGAGITSGPTGITAFFDRANTAGTIHRSWNSRVVGELLSILPMNISNQSLQYPIILSAIYLQGTIWSLTGLHSILIQGSNSFSESSNDIYLKPGFIYNSFLSRSDRELDFVGRSAQWETIASIPVASISVGTGFYGSVANSAAILPVNSPRPYVAHRIVLRHAGTQATDLSLTDVEFYGSLIT